MRKLFKLSTLWLLALVVVFTLFACELTPPNETSDPEAHVLAGEYEIDISNFGMPLVFYLKINEDGTFQLAPNRNFAAADLRGEGQLAESDGLYMMIYKEHTSENPKTATFVVEDHNLIFQTTLPYGASNIRQSSEDPDNPEIIYILTAHILIHEDHFGLYAGHHTVSAMGSQVTYNYTIKLMAGLKYEFTSYFKMGGTDYSHKEVGSWNVDGETFTLTPKDEESVSGTIIDGVISTSIKASWMATTRTQTTLQFATHSDYAGSFVGKKVSMMYTANVSIVLDLFGGYVYTADVGQPDPYTETGTYEVDGTTITFTPTEGEPYTATLENHVMSGNFKVIGAMPATSLVFYNAKIQGTFTGSATHDDVEYTTTLILNSNGTFELLIVDEDDETVVEATGTFTINKTMMIMVVLTGVVPQPSIALAAGGLNFNMLLPGMEEGNGMSGLGFFLSK
jgi:hypothetical protein